MKKVLSSLFLFLVLPVLGFSQSSHSVGLSWTASPDAAANPSLTYNIYRENAPTGGCPATVTSLTGFTQITTGVSGTTFTDGSPGQIGTPLCYVATAVINGAESVPSNDAPARVLPSPPSNVVATPK